MNSPFTRIVVACLLALVLGAVPAQASHTQTTYFEAPRDLQSPDKTDATLDKLQSLGVTAIREVLPWSSVAPDSGSSQKPDFDTTDPAAYNWGVYDQIVSKVKARGMKLLLTVSGGVPKWATRNKTDNVTYPNPSEFTQFMVAVAKHYGSQVDHWSIWNEPNQPQFLMPQFDAKHRPVSPTIYRALYKGALRAFDNVGMKPSVLFGETSPRGNSHIVAPLVFLRDALCLSKSYKLGKGCGRMPMAGFAHHAYTTRAGPHFRPSQKDDVTIGVLSRLSAALKKAAKAGAVPNRTPIWLTEFGIQSTPDQIVGVPLQQQAEYRSISERIAYDNPGVAAFSQYLLTDDAPTKNAIPALRYGGFESGLVLNSGKAKPSLDGFRLALAAKRSGSRVGLWGLVRPATGSTRVAIQYRNGPKGAFRNLGTATTDARGYFRMTTSSRKGRQYRVSWIDPKTQATMHGAPTRVYAY